jgi:two-component system, chemotaxis family, chemotaxis protein CheY
MNRESQDDVLVVDDDAAIRNLVRLALQRSGLKCGTAADGLDAIERLRETRYTVILLDLMMPRLDGIGVINQLRETVDENDRPIVVVMTAFSDLEHASLDGTIVHTVIRKPFDLTELAGVLQSCVTERKAILGAN